MVAACSALSLSTSPAGDRLRERRGPSGPRSSLFTRARWVRQLSNVLRSLRPRLVFFPQPPWPAVLFDGTLLAVAPSSWRGPWRVFCGNDFRGFQGLAYASCSAGRAVACNVPIVLATFSRFIAGVPYKRIGIFDLVPLRCTGLPRCCKGRRFRVARKPAPVLRTNGPANSRIPPFANASGDAGGLGAEGRGFGRAK